MVRSHPPVFVPHAVLKICPNVVLVMLLLGFANFGVLVRLKNSARNSNVLVEPRRNARNTERSTFH